MVFASVRHFATSLVLCLLAAYLVAGPVRAGAVSGQEGPPIAESGVRDGLTVWVEGDMATPQWPRQLHNLHKQDGRLVLGLHADAEVVARARKEVARLGCYGKVSVDRLPSKSAGLPLIAESVNLLVVGAPAEVDGGEIERVLAPLGTAMVREGDGWRTITKPWPDDLGQWTHYLGDATNNAVARDRRIAPPRHLQFQTGPRWSRHHDHMSSVSALVSAEGRVFGIFDEGRYESPQLPPDWNLVARDAFNGALLWKRPIARWHSALWPLKSGPASLPRRLVVHGDEVYATLGIDAPVTALDAATGRALREYAGTAGAEEIVRQGDVLLVLVNRTPEDLEADLKADPEEGVSRDHRTTYSAKMGRIWAGIRSPRWTHSDRAILAFDAASGRQLWKVESRVVPLTLAADADRAYYHDNEKVVAVRLADGTRRWASEPVPVWQGLHGQGLQSWFAPSMLVHDGFVVVAGGEKMHMSYFGWGSDDIGEDTMTAFSAETGETLWTADHPYSGYNSPQDLLVAQEKVWVGCTAKGGGNRGFYAGHDLRTGRQQEHFPPTLDTYWFHHRCYRAKATENYILSSRTGIEFVDLQTGEWTIHHWVRGACLYGIMPANGLVYAPPHPCACYSEALLKGLVALAPPTRSRELPKLLSAEERLYMRSQVMDLKGNRLALGPAGSGHPHLFAPYGFTDDSWFHRTYWVYGDGFHGGIGGFRTGQAVPAGRILACNDETVFGYGRKTDYWQWTSVLENHLFAAVRPKAQRTEPMVVEFENTVSLDPAGKPLTIAAWVRTVATDGTILVRGANVHGFGLILADRMPQMLLRTKGTTHVAAARKAIDDGWTHVAGVLAEDGRMTVYVDGQAAGTTENVPLLGGTPIIPMRVGYDPTDQLLPEPLTPFQGALDEVMLFHRALSAQEIARLADPDVALDPETRAGQVLHLAFAKGVLRDRSPAKNHGNGAGTKFQTVPGPVGDALRFEQPDPAVLARRRGAQGKMGYLWSREVPMMVRAMAVAGDRLLIAGPPDVLDELAAFQAFDHPDTQKHLAEQNRALCGEGGALFHAVDTATGKTLAEYPLETPPVFDGLIAAGGRVFLVTMDGRVLAFAGR